MSIAGAFSRQKEREGGHVVREIKQQKQGRERRSEKRGAGRGSHYEANAHGEKRREMMMLLRMLVCCPLFKSVERVSV